MCHQYINLKNLKQIINLIEIKYYKKKNNKKKTKNKNLKK